MRLKTKILILVATTIMRYLFHAKPTQWLEIVRHRFRK